MKSAGLIAKKIGMTRMVDAEGRLTAVTLLQVEEQKVTKILTAERDGYHGFQVGYYAKAEKHLGKPDMGRLRKANVQDNYVRFKEFRLEGPAGDKYQLGQQIDMAPFFEGLATVDITGVTKGTGFSGAHKRYNAAVGRMSHGSRFHRQPGSLGMRSTPGRVFKNRPQPGHDGDLQVTVQNLQVLDVDKASGILAVRGSVPGHRDGFLIVRPSLKHAVQRANKQKK
jgi:large subunit ribosomal protein L3